MLDLNALRNAAAKPSGRRIHHRRKFEESQIRVDLGFTSAILRDLSESGMAVRATGALRMSPGAQLQVSLPDVRRPIQATCQLAWTSPSGMAGMRFLVLAQGSQRSIRDWLTCEEPCHQSWTSGTSSVIDVTPTAEELKPLVVEPLVVEPAVPPPVAKAPAPIVTPITAPSADISYGLRLIVELIKLLTRADGAALALRDGETMICRASMGAAPDIGVQLRADSGLSGECMRTGLTVRSDDTSCDPRVDAEACRALGVGSIAVTPVFRNGATDGILEILSRRSHGFTHTDIALLPQMADLVARLITRNKENSEPGSDSGSGIARAAVQPVAPTARALMDSSSAKRAEALPEVQHRGRRYISANDEPGQGTIRIAPPGTVGNA